MRKKRHLLLAVAVVAALGAATVIRAQQQSGLTAEQRQRRIDTENELEQLAVIERKVMMPMPDGVRLATPPRSTGAVTRNRPGIGIGAGDLLASLLLSLPRTI